MPRWVSRDVYKRQLLHHAGLLVSGVIFAAHPVRLEVQRLHILYRVPLFQQALGYLYQTCLLYTSDATDEECIAADRLANADGFIKRLPEGYNTCLLYTSKSGSCCWVMGTM